MSGMLAPSLRSRRSLWLSEWRSAEPAAMTFLVPRVSLLYNNSNNNNNYSYHTFGLWWYVCSKWVCIIIARWFALCIFFLIIQIIVVSKGTPPSIVASREIGPLAVDMDPSNMLFWLRTPRRRWRPILGLHPLSVLGKASRIAARRGWDGSRGMRDMRH